MAKPENQPSGTTHSGPVEPPQTQPVFELSRITQPPRAGDLCPQCGKARLDYDGTLNLACPACGFALAGSCT